jgi:hypothetical protein
LDAAFDGVVVGWFGGDNCAQPIPANDAQFMMKRQSDDAGVMTAGCAIGIASALFTGFLLYVNGSLVLAVISALNQAGTNWLGDPRIAQCFLFLVPVLMVVVEWMMIDYVRTRFVRRAK